MANIGSERRSNTLLVAEARNRPRLARLWWRLSFGIVFVCLILPVSIVLLMFLSDSAYDAIQEMGTFFFGPEYGWLIFLTLGWLTGSGVMAWIHRQVHRAQDPPRRSNAAPLGPVEWMYVGFTISWYIVLAIGFGLTLGAQTNHFLTALAFFLFVPGLFGGFCGVCGGTGQWPNRKPPCKRHFPPKP